MQEVKILVLFLFCMVYVQSVSISRWNFFNRGCVPGTSCNETRQIEVNFNNSTKKFTISEMNIYCDLCTGFLPIFRKLIIENKTEQFSSIATFICYRLEIQDKNICWQTIKLYEDSLVSVAKNSPLNNMEICSAVLGCFPLIKSDFDWNITLPNVPKPPIQPIKPAKSGSPTLRILQLTDIHIDFEYRPGSLAECGQPLCCRSSSYPITEVKNKSHTEKESQSAGFWGDYRNCDLPVWTFEHMLDYISKNEEFDFIYWTGDLPPHNIWNQTREEQLNALDRLTEIFAQYFPNKIIFASVGNHEAAPCNLFPTPNVKEDNITWLYSKLASQWPEFGLPKYLTNNITNGAFYTVKIAPQFRLISINMNYCSNLNFWLLINSTDPLRQLEWLAEILQYSESKGEKVHIIGHFNPSGCLKSWSSNYYRIVNRYEATITGQFFGHTHNDEFEIFYDLEDLSRAVGVAYIAPSATTYSFRNPSYRIYTVDGDYRQSSFQVIDHETYSMNMTRANLIMEPVWYREYSAKKAYNLENLLPQSWNDLIDAAINNLDGEKFNKLYFYYHTSVSNTTLCDTQCKQNFACKFKQARTDYFIKC